MVKLRIVDGATAPVYQTQGSAGADLVVFGFKDSVHADYTILEPGEKIVITTGVFLEDMDRHLELQVRSRSGLAIKQGLVVINSPGTIDSDYKGEIMVCILNTSQERQTISKGDRIAQLVCSNVIHPFECREQIRNEGGFGSTGV
jgi:dUTP pyrophosphatase